MDLKPVNIPELSIAHGSSGLEIRAMLGVKFNCKEFTLRDDVPQPIFISPWMQFEPSEMSDVREQIAYEIIRRALAYDRLMEALARERNRADGCQQRADDLDVTLNATYKLWRADRDKSGGFAADFSDTKMPPEMMNDYSHRNNPPPELYDLVTSCIRETPIDFDVLVARVRTLDETARYIHIKTVALALASNASSKIKLNEHWEFYKHG